MDAIKGFGVIGLAMMAGLPVAALHGEPAGIAVVLAQGTEVPSRNRTPPKLLPRTIRPRRS